VTALEIISLVIKYGPTVLALIRAIAPLLEAAKPIVERLVQHGLEEHKAWEIAIKTMDREDEERWFRRAMGEVG
jgi:hypothetical protein